LFKDGLAENRVDFSVSNLHLWGTMGMKYFYRTQRCSLRQQTRNTHVESLSLQKTISFSPPYPPLLLKASIIQVWYIPVISATWEVDTGCSPVQDVSGKT
jgi:hypothetical protein